MKKLNTHIAHFLLLAFAWVILPTQSIHDIFANHTDTADNYCAVYHSHLGTHVEEQHTHCDILDLNTPVYNTPEFVAVKDIISVVSTLTYNNYQSRFVSFSVCNLPSRAPPVSA